MASYHLTVKVGAKGDAGSHGEYIAREGPYKDYRRGEKLEHVEHGNLPAWAEHDPVQFWRESDQHERVNGSTYREIEIALPREFTAAQRIDLVREFVGQEIGDRHAYSWAIHSPAAALEGGEQPHAHIMYSERIRDGIERDPDQYFKRHNAKNPERGGCKKGPGFQSSTERKNELIALRERWADLQNRHLEHRGHDARVDHRSLEAQGIERTPERHIGPSRVAALSPGEIATLLEHRQAEGERERAQREVSRIIDVPRDLNAALMTALKEKRAQRDLKSPVTENRPALKNPALGLGHIEANLRIADRALGVTSPETPTRAPQSDELTPHPLPRVGETLEQAARRVLARIYDDELRRQREAKAEAAERRAAEREQERRKLESQAPGAKPMLFGRREWEEAHRRWNLQIEFIQQRIQAEHAEAAQFREGQRDSEFKYALDPSGWQFGAQAREVFARQHPDLRAELDRIERERKEAERRERERPKDPDTQLGRYTGRVRSVDDRYVYQDHGDRVIRHERRHFEKTPRPGQEIRVQYRQGLAEIEHAHSRIRQRNRGPGMGH